MNKKIPLIFFKEGHSLYGAEKATLILLKNIDRNKFMPVVIVLEYSEEESQFFKEAQKLSLEVIKIRTKKGFDFNVVNSLKSIIKRNEFPVVVTIGYKCNILGVLASCGRRLMLVCVLHAWASNDAKLYLYNFLDKYLFLRFFDCVITVSPAISNEISGIVDKARVSCIFNCVDIKDPEKIPSRDLRTEFGIDKDCKIIIYAGRIEKAKGLGYLLQSIKILEGKEDLKLLIVGDGSLESEIKSIAQSLNVSDAIIFTGFIPEVYEFIKSADLFILPSKTGEGISLAAMEAMVLSVPVIVTSAGGMSYLITNGVEGLLVKTGDSEALAKAIESVLHNEELRREIILNAKERIFKHFTVENMVTRFEKAILDCYVRRNI